MIIRSLLEDLASLIGEARLTMAQREQLPDSAFVMPKQKKWPIHDLKHAMAAIAYAKKHVRTGAISKSEYAKVIKAVRQRYPQINIKPL